MRYQGPASRGERITRLAIGLAVGPGLLVWGIVDNASQTVSCGDETISPGEVCVDQNSGKTTSYDQVASGSHTASVLMIIAGIIITLGAAARFAYRWQHRAERPLLPPKQPRRAPLQWTWIEARLAENAQYGLAVRVGSGHPTVLKAREDLRTQLRTRGATDPAYARGASALAADATAGTVLAPPLLWFFAALPARGERKQQIHEVLTAKAPQLRELLREAGAKEAS
jgi:hypothetical protein